MPMSLQVGIEAEAYRKAIIDAITWIEKSSVKDPSCQILRKDGAIFRKKLAVSDPKKWYVSTEINFDLSGCQNKHQSAIFLDNCAYVKMIIEIKAEEERITLQKIQFILFYRGANGSCCERSFSEKACQERVVRKFHFDFETKCPGKLKESKDEPHPVFHIQYGGNIFKQPRTTHYCLEPELEIPRIPSIPLSVISVLDIFMCQFQVCPEWYNSAEWKKHVTSCEKIFSEDSLKQMYKSVGHTPLHEFMTSTG